MVHLFARTDRMLESVRIDVERGGLYVEHRLDVPAVEPPLPL
jgi:hypothetical protein